MVEKAHFTEKVRSLKGGENSEYPLGDLEYTLRAFPNHHQALYSIIRYATEKWFTQESGKAWNTLTRHGRERAPPECYLQRAMAFAPTDYRVYLLAGVYFQRMDLPERALKDYKQALSLNPKSAESHYNLGLLLVDMGKNRAARRHARKAYKEGYPLDGLRKKLAAAGFPIHD